ncbi:MAG: phosphatidate cytidylyltransferase [Anaerolineae bacterium]|nr:phosphatidate cytidylyltransferase [Anaerolineae bacterium]
MLRTRALSAVVLVPLVALVVWASDPFLALAVVAVGLLAWRELAKMLRLKGYLPFTRLGAVLVVLFIWEPHLQSPALFLGALTLTLMASLIFALYQAHPAPATDWALTFGSAAYLGLLLGHFPLLRNLPDGFWWLTVAILATWINDTAAYFVGSRWGRHKLFVRISPKKTWEGFFGGLVITVLLGVWPFAGWLGIHPGLGALLGIVIGIAATYGDLAESLWKRQSGIKDSGQLIPGHGGMFDRVDSLLFIVPVVYYFAVWVAEI